MMVPFEKFKVWSHGILWGSFAVDVKIPKGQVACRWLDRRQRKFIEDAIREKIEREKEPR